ncbi:MAG: hypothetical protein HYR94_16890 [Chloroflexi bacterium]|nr:hypothetical protein [Chloroflexota bacterium]
MKIQLLTITLAAINLVLLLFILTQARPIIAQNVAPVLRAQAIELIDNHGQIRAQLNAESNGEVVFRLRDANGVIRVKLGAAEDGSGLLLLDEATEPGVHILVKPTGATLTLTGQDGQQRVIKP